MLVDLGHLDPATIERSVPSEAGGRFALENFNTCLRLAQAGRVDAVCFTPFNKAAMRLAHPSYEDEIVYSAEYLGTPDIVAREFNVLEGLWNARVTSHVPLSQVASLITTPGILNDLRLTDRSLREARRAPPRNTRVFSLGGEPVSTDGRHRVEGQIAFSRSFSGSSWCEQSTTSAIMLAHSQLLNKIDQERSA